MTSIKGKIKKMTEKMTDIKGKTKNLLSKWDQTPPYLNLLGGVFAFLVLFAVSYFLYMQAGLWYGLPPSEYWDAPNIQNYINEHHRSALDFKNEYKRLVATAKSFLGSDTVRAAHGFRGLYFVLIVIDPYCSSAVGLKLLALQKVPFFKDLFVEVFGCGYDATHFSDLLLNHPELEFIFRNFIPSPELLQELARILTRIG